MNNTIIFILGFIFGILTKYITYEKIAFLFRRNREMMLINENIVIHRDYINHIDSFVNSEKNTINIDRSEFLSLMINKAFPLFLKETEQPTGEH